MANSNDLPQPPSAATAAKADLSTLASPDLLTLAGQLSALVGAFVK